MKKIVSLLLVFLLLLAAMVGCGSEPATTPADTDEPANTAAPGTPAEEPTDEPADAVESPAEDHIPTMAEAEAISAAYFPLEQEDSISCWMPWSSSAVNHDISRVWIMQYVQEKTNVNVEWEVVPSEANTKFNLMITSGEYLDILHNFSGMYTGTLTHAVEEEIIIDMTEYIPEYLPNYYAMVMSSERTQKEVSTDDGSMPVIWTLNTDWDTPAIECASLGLVYREDWAKQLGFDEPKTISDWHDFLVACKTNIDTCITPLSLWSMGFWDWSGDFVTAYDTYPDYYVRDGKVCFGPLDPGYRDAVQLMADWWQEDLLDPDKDASWFGDTDGFCADETAASPCLWQGAGTYYYDAGMVDNENWNLAPAMPPVLNESDTPKAVASMQKIAKYDTAFSTQCENLELAARWFDIWYTEDVMKHSVLGEEGVTYDVVDGEYVFRETNY